MLQTVSVVLLPNVAPFELGVACEVFGIDRSDTGGPVFDFRVCAQEPGPVSTKGGAFGLSVEHDLSATLDADLVVVPAYGADPARVPDPVLDALCAAHARGAWILSICSGAFALGEAGLLDDRACTTHWMHAAELASRFPAARVDPSVLYVDDDRVLTSAGTAAGIDASLYLVRRELGAAAAATIARRMVVPPHRDGGQAQYVDTPLPCDADTLAPLLAWVVEHLDEEHSVPTLAARALMSERTFARRFRAETGTTPAAWLTRQRLARAQELLERTDVGIDEVAQRAGFGTSAVLRHHFARSLGTSPQSYRRTFAGPVRGEDVA
ncbi:AraC family transcriptional regulator [Cellulomonas sp. A375-1]|uniref:AraC family transcriptional regulator n=1 Tax=Cellulomonas gelida TaxID=1712 RepID=A0A4Y3KGT8_9CELL|nr:MULTISPECIES: helix-turn-helix domain-containing protein [Cellulomonas]KMM44841.1 AraC family transcriptional regulator [Cellulomonas sp. A375-1]MCR6706384.1 helix-turn-helix domain-containing protein [Cellulomonas sp.]GEA83093.1 AraC family transcriptional regulator [Cellulomonas gelida]GGL30240.1 AraC family transcriptional regulator [Cellulomonas gelida]